MKRYKIFTLTILAMMLAAMPHLFGQIYHSPGVGNDYEPLDIEVWTNKEEGGSFGQGENLIVYFRANRDCYVTIYDLDTKGNINLLYPFNPQDNNFVEAGVVYTIPDFYDDYVLRVNGPPGLEFVQAIASLRYFDVPDWRYNFRDDDFWFEFESERDILRYLEQINYRYFPIERCIGQCDMDYTFFEVRKNWRYSWDSYYYDDYTYYDDHHAGVEVHHYYHPYYYRPAYYDPWWDPWDWCGTVYIGYPHGGAIWINGIFYGYAPLWIPRVHVGWCDVRIVHSGSVYYHDRVKIRRGISHEFYHEGSTKWKTSKKVTSGNYKLAEKYYPKSKSISYRSSAKYTAGGKDSKYTVYKSGGKSAYSKGRGDSKSTSSRYEKDDRSTRYNTGSKYRGTDKTATKESGRYDKGSISRDKSSSTATRGKTTTKSDRYDKGSTSSKSGKSSSDKSDKARSGKSSRETEKSKSDKSSRYKSSAPSARFQKKSDGYSRSGYGSDDSRRSSGSSVAKGYNKGSSSSSYDRGKSRGSKSVYDRGESRSSSSSPSYKRSKKGSSSSGSTYNRGSSSSRSSGSSYKGSSGSSSSSRGGSSYKGSSGSSGSSSSSSKSSGSRSSSKGKK